MSTLQRLTDAEQSHDYAIPDAVREGIRYGSHLDSLIAEHRSNVGFYRGMILSNRKSAREWFRRGEIGSAESCRKDSWIYLTGWRTARKNLATLESEKRVNSGTLQTLSGIQAMLGGRV